MAKLTRKHAEPALLPPEGEARISLYITPEGVMDCDLFEATPPDRRASLRLYNQIFPVVEALDYELRWTAQVQALKLACAIMGDPPSGPAKTPRRSPPTTCK